MPRRTYLVSIITVFAALATVLALYMDATPDPGAVAVAAALEEQAVTELAAALLVRENCVRDTAGAVGADSNIAITAVCTPELTANDEGTPAADLAVQTAVAVLGVPLPHGSNILATQTPTPTPTPVPARIGWLNTPSDTSASAFPNNQAGLDAVVAAAAGIVGWQEFTFSDDGTYREAQYTTDASVFAATGYPSFWISNNDCDTISLRSRGADELGEGGLFLLPNWVPQSDPNWIEYTIEGQQGRLRILNVNAYNDTEFNEWNVSFSTAQDRSSYLGRIFRLTCPQ